MRTINLNQKIGFRIDPTHRRKAFLTYLRERLEFLETHEKVTAWPVTFDEFLAPDADGICWDQAWVVMQHFPIGGMGVLPYEIVLPDVSEEEKEQQA